jgi:hypothetical protein
MDRPMLNLLARVLGALAFAAFLMHAGQHLLSANAGAVPPAAWGVVALVLVAAVAAAWAQARLNAKRPALVAALVLTGLVPVGAFLLGHAPLDAPGGQGVILLLGLLFGLATCMLTGWLLVLRSAPEE